MMHAKAFDPTQRFSARSRRSAAPQSRADHTEWVRPSQESLDVF
jgi:hypothetical protein